MIRPVGVTTKKNISAIIKGLIILPNITPNFNQINFKGVKNFEFKIPSNKKTNEMINGTNFKSPLFKSGNKAIAKKIRKNNIPKLLLELTLTSPI